MNQRMIMTSVLTFVSVILLQSTVACTASRLSQGPAASSDADISQPDPASNTVELLQDIHGKMSTFQEQLERQAETIARQELQLQSQKRQIEELKQSERNAEMIVREELEQQKREIEGLKQLVKTQQERQADTTTRQELQLQSQKRQIEELKQWERKAEIIARQELEQQKREIEGFKQLVKMQQERQAETITRQELKLQSQQKEMEDLKQLVKMQQETINTHAKHMVTTQKRLLTQLSRKFKLRLDKMSHEITEMAASIAKETNPPSRIARQVQLGNVAFSAYLDGDVHHLPGGYIIKMKGVNLNEGNAYNPSNGIFTTPHNGVYLFSFAVTQYQVHQVIVTLVVDGSVKSMVITEPFHLGQNIQGTNVVILRLITGQQVWTEIDMTDTDDFVEGNSRYKLTTFSGVFLYP